MRWMTTRHATSVALTMREHAAASSPQYDAAYVLRSRAAAMCEVEVTIPTSEGEHG